MCAFLEPHSEWKVCEVGTIPEKKWGAKWKFWFLCLLLCICPNRLVCRIWNGNGNVWVCSHRWFFCRNAKATVNKLHTNKRWVFIRIALRMGQNSTKSQSICSFSGDGTHLLWKHFHSNHFVFCYCEKKERNKRKEKSIEECARQRCHWFYASKFHLRSEFCPFSSQQNITSHAFFASKLIYPFCIQWSYNKFANRRTTNQSNFFSWKATDIGNELRSVCVWVSVYWVPRAAETEETSET